MTSLHRLHAWPKPGKRWFLLLNYTVILFEVVSAFNRDQKSLIRLPANYVRSYPPIPENGPLMISIDIGLWAIRDISASKMDMEVDLFIYLSWPDYRVEINMTMVEAIGGRIPVGDEGPKLWLPVLQFRNCRGCHPLDLNPNTYIVHYHSELDSFWTAIRLIEKLSCNIDLRSFPMDRQNCKIQLENYYEDTSKVAFSHHHSGPYKFMSDLKLSEFRILDIMPGDCSATYGNKSYACLEIEVRFARIMGYHLTTTFSPTMFIVLLSWISFWLPVDLAPARITLGVTSLLTLATRLDQSQNNLPAVSYVKAIDIWMFACIFLVFASLVEFSLSYYWSTKITRKSKVRVTPYLQNQSKPKTISPSKNEENITSVDRISRIAFPVSFAIFNVCYWSNYLSRYYDD